MMQLKFFLIIIGSIIGLGGCVSYSPKPIDTHFSFESASQLIARYRDQNSSSSIAVLNPSKGVDGAQLAVLAVFNNPALQLARADANISHAQLFAAGLFPDPTVGYSILNPVGSIPGSASGTFMGIGYDLSSLWFRGINQAVARHETEKVDLGVLWLEWQSVAEAMMLYYQSVNLEKQSVLLMQYHSLYGSQLRSSRVAYTKSLVSSDVLSSNITLLDGIDKLIQDNNQQKNKTSSSIAALLGIDSGSEVPLQEGFELRTFSDDEIQKSLLKLDEIRPDLIALRIGYDAQEERVRKAVWAQFPAISVSLGHETDVTAVSTQSIGITLTLPLFERGRGAIAMEQASREKLFQEYKARQAYTRNEVQKILNDRNLYLKRLNQLQPVLKNLEEARASAVKAFGRGDIDEPTYVRYIASSLDKKMESLQVAQNIREMDIALYLLCGKIDWNRRN